MKKDPKSTSTFHDRISILIGYRRRHNPEAVHVYYKFMSIAYVVPPHLVGRIRRYQGFRSRVFVALRAHEIELIRLRKSIEELKHWNTPQISRSVHNLRALHGTHGTAMLVRTEHCLGDWTWTTSANSSSPVFNSSANSPTAKATSKGVGINHGIIVNWWGMV